MNCDNQMTRIVVELGLVGAYSALEYWLGRTKRVEASSLIELIKNLILRKGI